MKLQVSFLSLFLLFTFSQNSYAANPAPYTKEAENKLENAYKQSGHIKKVDQASAEEVKKLTIEKMRQVYEVAGYNYDDTIVQVANDIQNKSKYEIKNIANKSSIFAQIIMGVNMLMSDCKYFKIDCLKYFSTDAANAIIVIIGNNDSSSPTNATKNNRTLGYESESAAENLKSAITDGSYWLEVELSFNNKNEKKIAKHMMTLTNDNGVIKLVADEDHKFIILGKIEKDVFRAQQEDDYGGKVDFVGNIQNLSTIKGTLKGSSKDGKKNVTGLFMIYPKTNK